VVNALEKMNLKYPTVSGPLKTELDRARRQLESE
jgi:hypothetical protein